MIRAELVISEIGELATLVSGPVPRTGEAMSELGLLANAAIAVDQGRFVFVGRASQLRREVRLRSRGRQVSAEGGVVVPGFVDAHSHALFAGDRSHEAALKIRGASYTEIARSGGGLFATVRATRRASDRELRTTAGQRIHRMALAGSTTVEVKSGYALSHAGELRLLRLLPRIARDTGVRIVPTFLGAHAVPPEYSGRADAYIDRLIRTTLPVVARERLARFCDVFCEPGFFTVEQSERLLRAGLALGLGAKIHADEFVLTGGARLAARVRATSADHLLASSPDDLPLLAESGVVAVLLPVTAFASLTGTAGLGRRMVDAGVPVALGTDLSPNSWVEAMPIVLHHAVYSARLTPREALCAATVNAAAASGLAEEAGTIAVGRVADLAIFPVPSVDHLAYRIGAFPAAVYRQGMHRSSR